MYAYGKVSAINELHLTLSALAFFVAVDAQAKSFNGYIPLWRKKNMSFPPK